MTDLEALAQLAQEEARLWAGYGRGNRKNDLDYAAIRTRRDQVATPDVVLALVRVAQAAKAWLVHFEAPQGEDNSEEMLVWIETDYRLETAIRAAIADVIGKP